MAEPFIAEIIMFGSNFAPRSWAFCDGQLMAISSNSALFALIGTTYGGDGRTTFALPEMRGRLPIGEGLGPGLSTRPLGQRGGGETTQLNNTHLASHTHLASVDIKVTLLAEKGAATTNIAEANLLAATTNSTNMFKPFNSANDERAMSDESFIDTGSTMRVNNTGGNLAHNNVQPSLTMSFIIAMFGLFPSRS